MKEAKRDYIRRKYESAMLIQISNVTEDAYPNSYLATEVNSDKTIRILCNGKEYGCYGLKQFKPIPLTEEWLIRFEDINWLSKDIGGFFYWFDGEKKYVEFVHALQNTYFYIEQKELKWRGF